MVGRGGKVAWCRADCDHMGFFDDKNILVTGGSGFLGSEVVRLLKERGAKNIDVPRSADMDLRIRGNCAKAVEGKDLVIHLAAYVGGIGANQKSPGRFFYDNLIMGVQLIEEARLAGVEKFVIVGTVCAYPKFTQVPFKEEDIWNGYPEETNAPYGIAKKALLVQSQAYRQQYGFNSIFLLPTNLYGPGDHFDLETSHVIPAIIRKVYDAKKKKAESITLWGDGSASREFLYVSDAAEGLVLAAEKFNKPFPVNIGNGSEITIARLTETICQMMDFDGKVMWDRSKPNGQPRRSLDVHKARDEFGFVAKTGMRDGLEKTIAAFVEEYEKIQ